MARVVNAWSHVAAMQIPPRDDPRWRALVEGRQTYVLKGLATRMLLTRVRLICTHRSEASIAEAVSTAYDYFSRNLEAANVDIEAIFGRDGALLTGRTRP